MRSSNPAFGKNSFDNLRVDRGSGLMTVEGTVNRGLVLLLLVTISACWTWSLIASRSAIVGPLALGGALGGFMVAMVTIFKRDWAPVTAPIYALLEGLFLGAISAIANVRYPGIAPLAVALTFGVLFCMLVAYRTGLVRATEGFKLGVVAATGAICIVYLISLLMSLFGATFPFIHSSGPIGIVFSLVVVAIAALNLVLDFDFIEQGASQGAPPFMEWYAAFGLLVTLIWLYLEILRLLSKLNSRN